MNVRIEVDAIREITSKLDGMSGKVASIAKKAVNETARRAKKELAVKAKQRYTVKRGNFSDAMKIKGATVKDLTATITVKGKPLEIKNFRFTNGSRAGIRAQILKAESLKGLERKGAKAFITQFSSGHVAIVQRNPGKTYTKKGAKARRIMYGKRADMTQIRVLYSVSIPKMIENREVLGKHRDVIRRDLMETLGKYIAKLQEG